MDDQLSGITPDSESEDSEAHKIPVATTKSVNPESTPEPSYTTQPSKPEVTSSPVHINHAHKFIYGYIALIVLAAAMGGIYAWQHKKVNSLNTKVSSLQGQVTTLNASLAKSNAALNSTKTWSYENTYSLVYPSNWTVGEDLATNELTGEQPLITFTPPNVPTVAYPVISVGLYNTSNMMAGFPQSKAGFTYTPTAPESLTINGYKALYQQSVANGLTNDTYGVTNGTISLFINFQVSETSSAFTKYNASNDLTAFNSFAKSVKFLTNQQ